MATLAAVVYCLEGTNRLDDCLASVGWADRIVVLHAGEEPPLGVAGLRSAPVFRKWNPGGRDGAWDNEIGTDWVLELWGDERVDAGLREELSALCRRDPAAMPGELAVRIRSLVLGAWVEASLWEPSPAARVNRRAGAIAGGWRRGRAGRPPQALAGWVEDRSASRLSEAFERIRAVSDLWRERSIAAGEDFGAALWRAPVGVFCRLLFGRGLLRGGFSGLTLSTLAAYGALLHGARVWESRAGDGARRADGTEIPR